MCLGRLGVVGFEEELVLVCFVDDALEVVFVLSSLDEPRGRFMSVDGVGSSESVSEVVIC